MTESVGERLQALHDSVVGQPVPEWLEEASCGPAVKHLVHFAMHTADTGGTPADWHAWVQTHVPEASEKLVAEAEECMRSAGLWPWNSAAVDDSRGRMKRG